MKVKTTFPKKEFTPFTIELTVETQEEGQALYALFNYTGCALLFPSSSRDAVKTALSTHGNFYVGNYPQVIARGITYEAFYDHEYSENLRKSIEEQGFIS